MEGILPLLCLYTTLGVAFCGGMFACFREVMGVGGFRKEAVDSDPDPSPYEKIKTKRKKQKSVTGRLLSHRCNRDDALRAVWRQDWQGSDGWMGRWGGGHLSTTPLFFPTPSPP